MKKVVLIFAIIFICGTTLFSQNREERSLSSFDKLRVGQGIEVTLVKGNEEKAVVEVDGIDLDDVYTEVMGKTLRIGLENRRFGNYRRNIDVEITLTFKSLRGISASSAANVYSRSVIESDEIFIDVSSAGRVEIEVRSNHVELEASSAADIEIAGKTKTLEVGVSSAGNIRAYELEAEEVDARASSAGSLRCTATRIIDARASSGGSIRYEGNPDKEYTNTSSGGSVRRN